MPLSDLDRLERFLERGEPFGPGAPEGSLALGPLLGVELRRLVRMGPSGRGRGRLHPAGVLETAREAALEGRIGVARLVELRRLLADLESSLRELGAWAPDQPLWWRPLPEESELERFWQRLDEASASVDPPPETVATPWVVLAGVLPPEILDDLRGELEILMGHGELALERGTVGEGGEVSAVRTDEVRYLSGREPRLLAAAPGLAATVQWCLANLARLAARAFPTMEAWPPARAMLARYPGPSGGFRRHLDNPGGERDNGRALSLVLYLNPPDARCRGGELSVWRPGDGLEAEPAEVIPARGGSAALFDSRTVPHEVRPLRAGPARWSLAMWLNSDPQPGVLDLPLPEVTSTDVLLAVDEPPLPDDRILLHRLGEADARGRITVHEQAAERARAGIVSTVYGAGEVLERWCRHHLGIGFEHLILVFDGLDEPEEAAIARRLREVLPHRALTVWSGAEALGALGIEGLGDDEERLLAVARGGRGAQAVSARQTLHASGALRAAKAGRLAGPGLDWLLHLDADEWFHLHGPGRGGSEVGEHFAALSEAGVHRARYLDHELLLPGAPAGRERFKVNPTLAAARLGSRGWEALVAELAMGENDERPYFHGYVNGKSAVDVSRGIAAAGVHGWHVESVETARSVVLAGPSVLHRHFASVGAFCRKYLSWADADEPEGPRLFEPYRADRKAAELARELRRQGASRGETEERLRGLHRTLTRFTEREIEILEAAGLLLQVDGFGRGPARRASAPRGRGLRAPQTPALGGGGAHDRHRHEAT